jgi:hypothetical protein
MVLAGKIFILNEEISLTDIAHKFKGYKVEKKEEISLITEIKDIHLEEDLRANFSQDELIEVYHRGKKVSIPSTKDVPLIFSKTDERIFLIIVEKKHLANKIASQLSKILFISPDSIVEAKIPPDVFRKFHEEHFEDTKIVFFDDVDVPNVEKLSLYGSFLADTNLYHEYLKHGKVWYVVLKPKGYSSVVGVTRNCVITFFGNVNIEDFVEYAKKEIFPLIP